MDQAYKTALNEANESWRHQKARELKYAHQELSITRSSAENSVGSKERK